MLPTLPSLSALLTSPAVDARIEPAALEASGPEPRVGNKRGYDATFYHNTRPLFNGNRPVDPHYSDGRLQDFAPGHPLWYKRADGTWGQKTEAHYVE
jgi:hypothetical protein